MAGRSHDPVIRHLKRELSIDDSAILKMAYSHLEEMIRYALRASCLKFDQPPDEIRGQDTPGTELIYSDPLDFRALKRAWDNHYECKKNGDSEGALAYFKEATRLSSQISETRYKCMGYIQGAASHIQRMKEHEDDMKAKGIKNPKEMSDADIKRLIDGEPGTDGEVVVVQ